MIRRVIFIKKVMRFFSSLLLENISYTTPHFKYTEQKNNKYNAYYRFKSLSNYFFWVF